MNTYFLSLLKTAFLTACFGFGLLMILGGDSWMLVMAVASFIGGLFIKPQPR